MSAHPAPRPVQTFSDDYLARCRELSAMDIVRFLDDFKRIHGQVESATATGFCRLVFMGILFAFDRNLTAAWSRVIDSSPPDGIGNDGAFGRAVGNGQARHAGFERECAKLVPPATA